MSAHPATAAPVLGSQHGSLFVLQSVRACRPERGWLLDAGTRPRQRCTAWDGPVKTLRCTTIPPDGGGHTSCPSAADGAHCTLQIQSQSSRQGAYPTGISHLKAVFQTVRNIIFRLLTPTAAMFVVRASYNVAAYTTKKTVDAHVKVYGYPYRAIMRRTARPRQAAVDAVAGIVSPLFSVSPEVTSPPHSPSISSSVTDHEQSNCLASVLEADRDGDALAGYQAGRGAAGAEGLRNGRHADGGQRRPRP